MSADDFIEHHDDLLSDQQRAAKQAYNEEIADLRWVMSDPRGRRFMHRLLYLYCGIDRTRYASNPTDCAFNEGQANIGLNQQAALQQECLELYVAMLYEARQIKSGGS